MKKILLNKSVGPERRLMISCGESENGGNRDGGFSLRRVINYWKKAFRRVKIYYSNELLEFQTEGSTVVTKYCSAFAGFEK